MAQLAPFGHEALNVPIITVKRSTLCDWVVQQQLALHTWKRGEVKIRLAERVV